MELWKQAYRKGFGSDADDDMAQWASDIAAWRANWQGGYDAGEEWATALVADAVEHQDAADEDDEAAAEDA